jgi:hypothetical protein
MSLANQAAETAYRVLDKCTRELQPDGPWRWRCVLQNGARLPLSASIGEGFLELACHPEAMRGDAGTLERALLGNGALPGGARLALNAASRDLHLRADIALLDEAQLLDRLQWALHGFHEGHRLLRALDSKGGCVARPATTARETSVGEMLRGTSWTFTERGLNDCAAQLDADSAAPARVAMIENDLVFSTELVRCAARTARKSLALFLLTASGALRLARAYAVQAESEWSFGFQVCLPSAPAAEEIDHAMAALSFAHRICARESNVLLDEAAARSYLAARDFATNHQPQEEMES